MALPTPSLVAAALAFLALLAGCATTTTSPSGTPLRQPLCTADGPRVKVALFWMPRWRADQKEPALREALAKQGIEQFIARHGCLDATAPRRLPGDGGVPSNAALLRLAAAGGAHADRVVLVTVRELGPRLVIGLPVLVEGGTEVVVDVRVLDPSTSSVLADASTRWRNGGAFVVKGVDSLESDLADALEAVLLPVAVPGPRPDPLLGMGFGIDHVVIAVRDLEAARALFRDRLGFKLPAAGVAGRHASGTANASSYFANQSYLELLAVDDREKVAANDPGLLAFLEKGPGAFAAALSTSSASATAARLEALGLAPTAPSPGTVQRATDAKPPPPKWLTVEMREAAGLPLFFIQYLRVDYADIFHHWDEGYAQARAAPYYRQPNGARGVSALWIAVPDLEAASKTLQALSSSPGRDYRCPALGADVREFALVRQAIRLLRPVDAGGPTARFIAERGQGILGFSVEVERLDDVAGRLRDLPGSTGDVGPCFPAGRSLLVPGALAGGAWIEFHEPVGGSR